MARALQEFTVGKDEEEQIKQWRQVVSKVPDITVVTNEEVNARRSQVENLLRHRFVNFWLNKQNGIGQFTVIGDVHFEGFLKREGLTTHILFQLQTDTGTTGENVTVSLNNQLQVSVPELIRLEFPLEVAFLEQYLLSQTARFLRNVRELGREEYRDSRGRQVDVPEINEEAVVKGFVEQVDEIELIENGLQEVDQIVIWDQYSSVDLEELSERDRRRIVKHVTTLGKGGGKIRKLFAGHGLSTSALRSVIGKWRVVFEKKTGVVRVLGVFAHGDNSRYVKELARRGIAAP